MPKKFKEQYSEDEKQKLVEIAKYCGLGEASHEAGYPNAVSFISLLKEASGDENVGHNPVFGQAGIDKVGGSILRFLLETVVTLSDRLQRAHEINQELKSKLETNRLESRDVAIDITKACESVISNDLRACSDKLGKLLYQENKLYV